MICCGVSHCIYIKGEIRQVHKESMCTVAGRAQGSHREATMDNEQVEAWNERISISTVGWKET